MSDVSGDLRPRLIIVTDTTVAPIGLLEQRLEAVAAAAEPESVMIQLRDRQLPVRERLELGRRVQHLAQKHDQWFAVNDRVDLALILEADGVHLGERSVEVSDARRLVGPDLFISRACHDPAAAQPLGADAVVLSPVIAPRKGNPALGVEVAKTARLAAGEALLYALGGVSANNAVSLVEAGFDGVAVVGAVLDGRDPLALLGALEIRR